MSELIIENTPNQIIKVDRGLLVFKINREILNRTTFQPGKNYLTSECELNVTNLTSNSLVLRVRTTKKLSYQVDPTYSIISPNSKKFLRIFYYTRFGEEITSKGHRFKFEAIIIDNDYSFVDKNVKDIFTEFIDNKIPVKGNSMIKNVVFIDDNNYQIPLKENYFNLSNSVNVGQISQFSQLTQHNQLKNPLAGSTANFINNNFNINKSINSDSSNNFCNSYFDANQNQNNSIGPTSSNILKSQSRNTPLKNLNLYSNNSSNSNSNSAKSNLNKPTNPFSFNNKTFPFTSISSSTNNNSSINNNTINSNSYKFKGASPNVNINKIINKTSSFTGTPQKTILTNLQYNPLKGSQTERITNKQSPSKKPRQSFLQLITDTIESVSREDSNKNITNNNDKKEITSLSKLKSVSKNINNNNNGKDKDIPKGEKKNEEKEIMNNNNSKSLIIGSVIVFTIALIIGFFISKK